MSHNQEKTPQPEQDSLMSDAKAAAERLVTDRLIELATAPQEKPEEQPYDFSPPKSVQGRLTAQEEEYSRQFDIEDSKSTPRTTEQVRVTVIKTGHNLPPTAEEVEEKDLNELEEKRKEASLRAGPKPAKKHHKPRPKYKHPRDKGPPPEEAIRIRRRLHGEEY